MDIYVCISCYKNAESLPAIFRNLDFLKERVWNNMHVVFCTDPDDRMCISILSHYLSTRSDHVHLIINPIARTPSRTENIANARNYLLGYLSHLEHMPEYFVMMDSNEYACVGEIRPAVLQDIMERKDEWDSVSFDREAGYYDHWALSYNPFAYSFSHCADWRQHIANMRSHFQKYMDSFPEKSLIPVFSAFNGFAIYRTSKFIDCQYSPNCSKDLFPAEILKNHPGRPLRQTRNDDCEHRAFHLQAIRRHAARIFIYKDSVFKKLANPSPHLRGPA